MPKKEFNGTISLRCDDAMSATLKDIHLKHQVPPVALARGLIEAALRFYTEHRFFSFPVRIEPEAFQREWLAAAEQPQAGYGEGAEVKLDHLENDAAAAVLAQPHRNRARRNRSKH